MTLGTVMRHMSVLTWWLVCPIPVTRNEDVITDYIYKCNLALIDCDGYDIYCTVVIAVSEQ